MLEIKDISMQEFFDRAVRHLAQQKVQAVITDEEGLPLCVYNRDSLNCVIGWYWKDQDTREIEGVGIRKAIQGCEVLSALPTQFLEHMQTAHDDPPAISISTTNHLEMLKARLRTIAGTWKLNPAVIEELTEWTYTYREIENL